ncbi:MAG: DUF3987 domain-containing protein [Bacteroidia bacterium]|nr:DUF3987 domain-containing protein [Bacteroidia bacterium]
MTSPDFYLQLLDNSDTASATTAQKPALHTEDTAAQIEKLISELQTTGTDITSDYNDWIKIGFALAGQFGEAGRSYFHRISSLHPDYSSAECDSKYDECLKSNQGRTNISTLFYLAEQQGITIHKGSRNRTSAERCLPTQTTSDKNVALSFVETQEEDRTLPMIDEAIYSTLPDILRKATDTMCIRQEKDLILIGSIVTLSCALLPFRTIYHGRTIFPNMYLFVPGPAGSGKGRLDFCYRLVRPIHVEKREAWQIAQAQYKQELEKYRSLRGKDKAAATPPIKPPIGLLRIPANSSATSFAETMADNGNLIIFETEGDTVVNTFKSDYGNYSDNFRKAFAHEEFGYLRRGNDSEEREVTCPRLTVVLSGTPEQVRSLIPNAENGLLSRFIFYCMSSTDQWLDGFSSYDADHPLEKTFDDLGTAFKDFYSRLNGTEEIRFRFSFIQQQKFNDFFREEKQRMKALNGDSYTASSHRLSWAAIRMAMVLTALRMMESGWITDTAECSDTDFSTVLSIIKVISAHNDYVFNTLSDGNSEEVKVSETYSSAARSVLLSKLPARFTSQDMKTAAALIGRSPRTVERQIRRAIENGQVQELGRGTYKKI